MSEERIGELFSRLYLAPTAPLRDSYAFRHRLDQFLDSEEYTVREELAKYLRLEAGIAIPLGYTSHDITKFFMESPIGQVLDAVTLVWKYFLQGHSSKGFSIAKHAPVWMAFVARVLREENMSYSLDEKCGVHYFVDEEFERNRVSVIKVLQSPRYVGARKAFEDAHEHLDRQPPDTKASVKSIFEAVEIIARLLDSSSKNLNRRMVETNLKKLALATTSEATESEAFAKMFDGFAQWVDAVHYYRHGQGVEKVIAPSLSFAVYVLSSAAAVLRWLVEIDSKANP